MTALEWAKVLTTTDKKRIELGIIAWQRSPIDTTSHKLPPYEYPRVRARSATFSVHHALVCVTL
jgi:hypothetical protein